MNGNLIVVENVALACRKGNIPNPDRLKKLAKEAEEIARKSDRWISQMLKKNKS